MPSLTRARAAEILDRGRNSTFAVIGDFMLDRYLTGEVARISPEAPIPVVRFRSETVRLGGAGNVARNLRALGAGVSAIGLVGDDADRDELRRCLEDEGIPTDGMVTDPARVTTAKTRIMADHHPVARLDREEDSPLATPVAAEFLQRCERVMERVSAVILCDYAKGVLAEATVGPLLRMANERKLPVFVDPKPANFRLFRAVDLLTPNHQEACAVAGWTESAGERDPEGLCRTVRQIVDCGALLITCGKRGMLVSDRDGMPQHFTAVAREVFDVTGAGDTVIAVASLALWSSADLAEAAQLANYAAARVVGQVGTATVTPDDILASWS
jgi:D-beta-D-heptose 7-phosphate kinase/D-beta-D-heptose 1-phosphate adenosyltransferase